MVKLSAKDRRIALASAKGLSNKEIGAVEYPNATPESQAVLVSRVLGKTHVAQYRDKELDVLLNKHGVTKNQYIENIGQAMKATKIVTSHTEPDYEVPDHTVRLNANRQAERFLKFDNDIKQEGSEVLNKALKEGDELQMIRVLKNKGNDS
jgi:hypothetical protein